MMGEDPRSGSPYEGYLYAYPHKTAYRPLRPRPALRDVWAAERRDALFAYLHIPFCEMRCGFCNLFTRANPEGDQVEAFLRQVEREADAVADAIGPARFALGAVGGGTPTYLDPEQLARVLGILRRVAGPVALSVETSPATATPERLAVLEEHGVHRVSMGVQSFLDAEAHAAGRPQRRSQVDAALTAIRGAGPAVLNLDLIYGIDGQTPATWRESLTAALAWRPEEIYLYPLYVRPLTGLGRRSAGPSADWDAQRLELYRLGRDQLRAAGYRQLSMRQFRRADVAEPDSDYCCQDDGMVGIGCGARSYTTELHYSFDYAVSVRGVRGVIADYLARDPADFRLAEVGYALDGAEQRTRWLVKSLLRAEGCDRAAYATRFGGEVLADFPRLAELGDWCQVDSGRIRLTDEGLAHSDRIGPWLVSPTVRQAMGGYALR